mmetsp:Transcript_82348/g.148606  ORF Transcript_82348/g.148606 Transcript_82348/m.148606 type:complete len:289 (+) Transcript_82348:823-1689(+)
MTHSFLNLDLHIHEAAYAAQPVGIPKDQARREDIVFLAGQQPHRPIAVHHGAPDGEQWIPVSRSVRRCWCVAHRSYPATKSPSRAKEPQHGLATSLRHAHQDDPLALPAQQHRLMVNQLLQQLVCPLHGVHIQDVHPGHSTSTEGALIWVVMPRAAICEQEDDSQGAPQLRAHEEVLRAIPRRVHVEAVQTDEGAHVARQPWRDEVGVRLQVLESPKVNPNHLDSGRRSTLAFPPRRRGRLQRRVEGHSTQHATRAVGAVTLLARILVRILLLAGRRLLPGRYQLLED